MSGNNVYISRTATFMPNDPVENDEIENVLGMIGGKPSRARRIILRQNGIKQRYYVLDPATGEAVYNNVQITAQAVRNLLPGEGELNDIQCLVSGTTNPDQLAPNHAVMVQGELGNPPCEVVATSGICLSGVTALKYVYMGIKCGEFSNGVATASETASLRLRASKFGGKVSDDPKNIESNPEIAFEADFLRWMLSDGAGAFLLSAEPPAEPTQTCVKIDWLHIVSYANEFDTCMYAGSVKNEDGKLTGWSEIDDNDLVKRNVMVIKQDVKLLNQNIIPVTLVRTLEKVIEKTGLTADQVDYFCPHISSMYFYKGVQNALKEMDFEIPEDKWFTNLSTKGNTGAASIYIMLDELLKSDKVKAGDKILCFIPESGRFSGAFMLLTAV
ncbi:MAG: beta-ketoacyl-ACP synthase III [Gammaproteobacteria bacterium]|nr:beta-ketoacyl-ACP synthase III [Gammaproteobacteria bacterium]